MQREFYSNGKLLLSGEYAILDGALGLAVPTKYGQSLKVTSMASGLLEWTSLDEKNTAWFQGRFDLKSLSVISSSDKAVSAALTKLLLEAKSQNPSFLYSSKGVRIETKIDFPREWGLGSSSTLINNIALWAQVDAYQLLWNAFGGSGYDIACAQNDGPITYQLENSTPIVKKVSFSPLFKDGLYFVYLNKKQSSKEAIANYRKKQFDTAQLVYNISLITKKMISAQSLEEFETLMMEHENVLSRVLGIPTVKSLLFPDFPGAIKSLGAWGGDFVLATANENPLRYFSKRGFNTAIPFSKLIL
ncbi:GHMP kinase [Muricauda sp. JGD-17]|uniref:GHMP kinase n=1 Tax=Flagellimonas ochracea TaxID=2696472 RepID=A0A964WXS8_9FLAO|nr:GYDIA family GHMP kinase [Allomuricauda ochracea]NAY92123.1 GHMP kinase [Allomuricauda ochracea]